MEGPTTAPRLIDLRGGIDGAVKRSLFRLIEKPVESVLSLSVVNRLYAESLTMPESGGNYFGRVLDVLNIHYHVSDEDRAKIPSERSGGGGGQPPVRRHRRGDPGRPADRAFAATCA